MKSDLVSIIMPTYNRAGVIARAIKSVQKQTYKNWELLIIDDGSSDDTEGVIRELNDPRIYYEKLPKNKGACYARNQGLARADGEYIAFLDSDNVWLNNYLEDRVGALKNSSANVGGMFGYFMLIGAGKCKEIVPAEECVAQFINRRSNKALIRQMLQDNVIDTNTIVLKKECADKVSGFAENLRRLQDWEYFFRIVYFSGYRIGFRENCLVKNYRQKDSITSKKNNKAYWDAKLYFLSQYKDIMIENNCLEFIISKWLHQENPEISDDVCAALLKIVDETMMPKLLMAIHCEHMESKRMIKKFFSEYEALGKETSRLATIHRTLHEFVLTLSDKEFSSLLQEKGVTQQSKIALYGLGGMGEILYRMLKKSGYNCMCGIDRQRKDFNKVMIFNTVDAIPEDYEVDLILISPLQGGDNIKKELQKKVKVRILTVADLSREEE